MAGRRPHTCRDGILFTSPATSVIIGVYESSNRYGEILTQLPFELRVEMPEPDSGRGYSNEYVFKAQCMLRSNS